VTDADTLRRAMLDEATQNGPAVTPAAGPSPWRYPYWPAHDIAYEEEP